MIAVECYIDTYIVSLFGVNKRQIKHADGKGNVLNYLSNDRLDIIIGMVDEDIGKSQPRKIVRYNIVEDQFSRLGLKLSKGNNEKFLITIKDDIEHWILSRAQVSNINPIDYDVPRDPKGIHDFPHIEKTRQFQKFIKAIIDTNDQGFELLKRWIETFA